MKFYKSYFACWLISLAIVLVLVISSCAAQNKIPEAESIHSDGQSYHWRVEIKIQPHNNEAYSVLAVLGNGAQPFSFKPINDLLQGAGARIIIVDITATNSQVQELRESLFEAGATAVSINKANQD